MILKIAAMQGAMGRAGGIEAVVAAMRALPRADGVQQYGCGALLSLALNHADNQAAIARAGGVEAVLAEGLEDHLFLGRVLDKVRS